MPKHQAREHYSSNPMIVMEGGYLILEKKKFPNAIIASPGIQTCIMLAIHSQHGIAVAHIDNPFFAQKATKTLVNGLKQLGSSFNEMDAKLVGGDVGNPITGSYSIYQPIINELKQQGIKYTYKDYSWDFSLIASSAYVALRMLNLIGPESYFWSSLISMGLYAIGKLHAFFIENNFDLYVNVSDSKFTIVKNDLVSTKSLIQQASRHPQYSLFRERARLDKRSAYNHTALDLIRIQP